MKKFKFRIDEKRLKKVQAFIWCCSDRWRYRHDPHILLLIKSMSPIDACLVMATMRWDFDRVPLLLELGADSSAHRWCAFVMAAAVGDHERMEDLYARSVPDATALESALRWAIEEKHESIRERIDQWLEISRTG